MSNIDINLEVNANEFRQFIGLNTSEAIHIRSILIKNNILTVFLPLSNDFSGMAIKLEENKNTKRFILVNSNHTIGRQHFTICHELYHLYIQKKFVSEKCSVGNFDRRWGAEEYYADMFASYFILPFNGLMQMIPESERIKNKITLKTILKIEHFFNCSRSALLNRLMNLKLIDKTIFEEHKVNIIKNALLYGYDSYLYKPGNENVVIGDYGDFARDLFDKGIVSESSYFSLLEDIGIDLSEYDNNTDNE